MTSEASRRRGGRPDYSILLTALALVVIGLIFVYSASFAIALAAHDDVNYYVVRQAAAAVIGLVLMFTLMRIDYHYLRVVSPVLMIVAVLALVAVLLVGNDAYGARRWIGVGSLPLFQPSEFAKLALIIYIAAWLSSRGRDVRSFAFGFVPFIGLVGVVAALILMEPDTGTAAVLVMTTVALFFLAGASLSHLLTLVAIGSVTGFLLIGGGGYRADRITGFVSPEDDPSGLGFQVLQLLIALGSGGLEGLGLGFSRQKFFYIPGAHTDGVFAIIGEETGFVGAVVVLGLFAYLVYRGFRVALRARDDFGSYPRPRHRLLDRLPGPDQRRRHHPLHTAHRHPPALRQLRRPPRSSRSWPASASSSASPASAGPTPPRNGRPVRVPGGGPRPRLLRGVMLNRAAHQPERSP